MNLRILAILHAVITTLAGIVLVIAPSFIPNTVGISLDPSAYLICYLLAASEFSIAVLSYGIVVIKDRNAIRIIVLSLIIFHGSAAVLELYAFTQGLSPAIWGNIALRILAVILFYYFGIYKPPKYKK